MFYVHIPRLLYLISNAGHILQSYAFAWSFSDGCRDTMRFLTIKTGVLLRVIDIITESLIKLRITRPTPNMWHAVGHTGQGN